MSDNATNPEILGNTVTDTTSAAANTNRTTAVLAAPGAGLRYRIYTASVMFDISVATPAANSVSLRTNAALGKVGAITYSSQPAWDFEIPDEGVPLGANVAFNVITAPSAAVVGGIALNFGVNYVIEPT